MDLGRPFQIYLKIHGLWILYILIHKIHNSTGTPDEANGADPSASEASLAKLIWPHQLS